MFEDYNNSSQQPDTSGEYHYSYRSDAQGFQPSQMPAEIKPKKHLARRVTAIALCGALLIGGSFGAGWYLSRDDKNETQMMISERPRAEVDRKSVV